MNYLEAINKRISCRSFIFEPLDDKLVDDLADFLSKLTPPEKQIDWNFDTLPYEDMERICNRELNIKAPHYLVLRSDHLFFGLQNAGYIGEYAALYLADRGVSSLWQGCLRPDPTMDFRGSLPYVSTLAFGMSEEPFRSDPSSADRLPLEKIASGQYDQIMPIMQAARLAPSSFNRQPCFFQVEDNKKIHIFRKKMLISKPAIEYDQSVDAGAAIANVEAAALGMGLRPHTGCIKNGAPERKGYKYQATVIL